MCLSPFFPCWVITYMSIGTKRSSHLSSRCRLLVTELGPALLAVSGRVWVCLAWAVAPGQGGLCLFHFCNVDANQVAAALCVCLYLLCGTSLADLSCWAGSHILYICRTGFLSVACSLISRGEFGS